MTESSPPRRLIDRQGIAALADVTPAAVTNWIRRYPGEFPEAVDGEFFGAEEVQEWLKRTGRARKVPVTADQLGRDLMALLRMDLPRDGVEDYAMTLITIAAATEAEPRQVPMDAAEYLERAGLFPRGALTGPLITASVAKPTSESALLAAHQAIARGRANQISPAAIFEALLASTSGSRGFAGHSSSSELTDFMAALVPPGCHSVYDPACGVGGSLLSVHARYGADTRLIGGDINPGTWALCVQRMHLAEAPADIRCEDAAGVLERPPAATVDAIVTAPPIGVVAAPDSPMGRLAARHELPNRSELVWALAALEHSSPAGTVVVTVPAGALFRGGTEREARRELVRSGALRAVFLLPPGAYEGTSIRVAVLVLKQGSPNPGPVLLADMSREDLQDPSAVLSQYEKLVTESSKVEGQAAKSTAVPVLELMAGDVNLNPPYWLQVERDPTQARQQLTSAWAELVRSQEALPGPVGTLSVEPGVAALPEVTLQQMADRGEIAIMRPSPTHEADTQTSAEPIVRNITSEGNLEFSRDDDTHTATLQTQPGDIVMKNAGRISAGVDLEGGHLVAGYLWVIRPLIQTASLNPELLAYLLRSPRIRAIAESKSSTMPRLTHPKQVVLPKLTDEQASQLLEHLHQLRELRAAATKVAKDAADAIDALIQAAETGNTIRRDDK